MGRILSIFLLITMLGVLSTTAGTTAQNQPSVYKRVIIANTIAVETFPDIASCPGSGGYLVVFEQGSQIIGQRLNKSGDLLGSAFEISATQNGYYFVPKVDCLQTDPDYYIVTWLYSENTAIWDI
jgi:hypothetical protein